MSARAERRPPRAHCRAVAPSGYGESSSGSRGNVTVIRRSPVEFLRASDSGSDGGHRHWLQSAVILSGWSHHWMTSPAGTLRATWGNLGIRVAAAAVAVALRDEGPGRSGIG